MHAQNVPTAQQRRLKFRAMEGLGDADVYLPKIFASCLGLLLASADSAESWETRLLHLNVIFVPLSFSARLDSPSLQLDR